ncbi:elongation factor 3, putative [Babesia caballi]|uniref:Elongation factor 3, putative n=1 Tax=Babesia caballi TaxID=5871 RepID=A0AAV4M1E9_BABCB|nr:elongation factor 3, putative [Babesia caballi]
MVVPLKHLVLSLLAALACAFAEEDVDAAIEKHNEGASRRPITGLLRRKCRQSNSHSLAAPAAHIASMEDDEGDEDDDDDEDDFHHSAIGADGAAAKERASKTAAVPGSRKAERAETAGAEGKPLLLRSLPDLTTSARKAPESPMDVVADFFTNVSDYDE